MSTLTGALNTVAGGGIGVVTDLLSGSFGSIIVTIVGLTILGVILYWMFKFLHDRG